MQFLNSGCGVIFEKKVTGTKRDGRKKLQKVLGVYRGPKPSLDRTGPRFARWSRQQCKTFSY